MSLKMTIGKIVKPQGIKGELKIKALTDDASRFYDLKTVFIKDVEYNVLKVRVDGDIVYLLLSDILDRNAAESFKNSNIEINREDAIALPEDRYFIIDIIGSDIVINDSKIGKLLYIDNYGASDIYTIELLDKKKVMIPALKKTILNIDRENKIITLDYNSYVETCVDID